MTTKTEQLLSVRDLLESLLDNYQIRDPGMTVFQSAMVNLQTAIDMPDPEPKVIEQPVVGTTAVIEGVLAGLSTLKSTVNSTASDVGQLVQDFGQILSNTTELRTAVTSVEADTAALRMDTAKIIGNTNPA